MILRRFSQSLKEQNWTTIVIEFVLLVCGVFIGIQVSNWNEDRVTQRKAAVFTERLKADLRGEDLTSNNRDIMENLRAVAGESP